MTRPENLNTPEQTGKKLSVSLPTLARWRVNGSGPKYIKVGHFVRYTDEDIADWLSANRRTFTAQTEAA